MKIIKPAEISAKIMTLIDDAEKELIIVSPYNNITGWKKLINRIKKAQLKGVRIAWYSRKNNVQNNNAEEVEKNLNISPILIDDLHAKIYMNEVAAIFTSMNMNKISDEKSLDLGYLTDSKNEYEEIKDFFTKHIKVPIDGDREVKQRDNIEIKTTKTIENEDKLTSNEYHVNKIHQHIRQKYGKYEYRYKNEEILEYLNFIRPGFKIQFIPYSQAIKTYIYLPPEISDQEIEKKLSTNVELEMLHKPNELSYSYKDDFNEEGPYIKYYFVEYNSKLTHWGSVLVKKFLEDLDIIISVFCPK